MDTLSTSDVVVRQWEPKDLKYFIEFVTESNWDMSMYDHEAYAKIDPNYLLVAVDKSAQPVGFFGVCEHTPGVVYFGSFIVRKDLRGSGIGKVLWNALLKKAGDKNVVLDAVSEMENWYKTHGFPFQSFKILFYQLIVNADMKEPIQSQYNIITLTEEMWPALIAYDRYVYPDFDRTRILKAWFTGDKVRVVVALDHGKIVGYGSIHKKPHQSNKYGIRNVFADCEDVVNEILHNMVSGFPEGATAEFMLVDGKPLPKYVLHSRKYEETAHRMFSKARIEVSTERMWFATAHIL